MAHAHAYAYGSRQDSGDDSTPDAHRRVAASRCRSAAAAGDVRACERGDARGANSTLCRRAMSTRRQTIMGMAMGVRAEGGHADNEKMWTATAAAAERAACGCAAVWMCLICVGTAAMVVTVVVAVAVAVAVAAGSVAVGGHRRGRRARVHGHVLHLPDIQLLPFRQQARARRRARSISCARSASSSGVDQGVTQAFSSAELGAGRRRRQLDAHFAHPRHRGEGDGAGVETEGRARREKRRRAVEEGETQLRSSLSGCHGHKVHAAGRLQAVGALVHS